MDKKKYRLIALIGILLMSIIGSVIIKLLPTPKAEHITYEFTPVLDFDEEKPHIKTPVPSRKSFVIDNKNNKINLAGNWSLSTVGEENTIPASIPGDVHSALIKAGKLPDPYYGTNEETVQWVSKCDWSIKKEFEVTSEFLNHDSVFLNIDTLDTYGEIFINGKSIGTTQNMFLRYRFDVKEYLHAGKNKIEVQIKSPEKMGVEQALNLDYPVPYSGNNQIPYMNLLRKVQCHAGWDWGICLAVSGIEGDISLNAVNDARLEHVYTVQHHTEGKCDVDVSIELFSYKKSTATINIKLGSQSNNYDIELTPGCNKTTVMFTIDNPELWWPAGYGKQNLYDLTVSTCGQTVKKRIGLRKLEIVNELPDEKLLAVKPTLGRSMTVRVNGVNIFCKGANWIPCDALPSRQTKEVYEDLLDSAVQANMNMLRVWGGGQYEKDIFYDLCDEKGLLVWQDLMFSCSQYPATKDFIMNVRDELLYQGKRLRDHPSIALWCGDNEVLGAINWYPESRDNYDFYHSAYKRLNSYIKKAITTADPTRTFWPSSPCGGPDDFDSDGWHNDSSGDMHYWSVWHGGKAFNDYYTVEPRFCSEFGYQSFPSLETVKTYAPESQFNVNSPVMQLHQKNSGGNKRIVNMFFRYFRFPNSFENFLYLSQVQQAVAIKTAVEYWRTLQPVCMGTLYWQLNDNWPVASWSSIEYGGKWKQLQYQAKRFYSPIIGVVHQELVDEDISPEETITRKSIEVWLVNDLTSDITAKVKVRLWNFQGKLQQSWDHKEAVAAQSSKRIQHMTADNEDKRMNQLFMTVDTKVATGDKVYTHSNTHFFTEYKNCELEKANVTWKVNKLSGKYKITVKTDFPAFFVTFEHDGIPGILSDNSFTLLPKEPKTLIFTPKKVISLTDLTKALRVNHLSKSY